LVDREKLINILRNTSAALILIRQAIADSGQLEAMVEIDTMLAVTQTEVQHSLAMTLN
jgi:hypothetical protein